MSEATMPSKSPTAPQPVAKSSHSDRSDRASSPGIDAEQSAKEPATATALATADTQRSEAALGDYVLRLLRIRKGPKKGDFHLDAVCGVQMFNDTISSRERMDPMTKLTHEKGSNTTQHLGPR
jgi:hypothetical protein